MIHDYLNRWHLIPDGEPIMTHSSELLPVRYQGIKAMLKIAVSKEERGGAKLMVWWNGEGAAPILRYDENALLMERAISSNALVVKAKTGFDDEASQILCSVAAKLHSKKDNPPQLLSINSWFKSLEVAALTNGGIYSKALNIAVELLATPQEIVILHGDLHHANVLDFGDRGWLAIDPKHITGERGYDFANIFCNPDKDVALQPGRLLQQVQVVAAHARLDKKRLLKWIVAYAGLSASWSLEDGDSAELALAVAEIALCEL